MKRKPKALDLFCAQGGASMGLYQAGFDVEGVDNKPQPRYPFKFHLADALTFDLRGYDFYWASPPCQFASELTPITHRANHQNLIPAIRERLIATGKPYAIENVENARQHLINPIKLCGSMFGLKVWRHRYVECSFFALSPPCSHNKQPVIVSGRVRNGKEPSVHEKRKAMQCKWMTVSGLDEAIPPPYSAYIAQKFFNLESC